MISRKELKRNHHESIEGYFGCIVDAHIRKHPELCDRMITNLSKPQAIDFISWVGKNRPDMWNSLQQITMQILKR